MQQLARNIVAAHKRVRAPACCPSKRLTPASTQLDELVRALPASEPLQEQLARIVALRTDLAASGAELEAELERAGARVPGRRCPCRYALTRVEPQPPPSSSCATSSPQHRTLRSAPAPPAPMSGDDDSNVVKTFVPGQRATPPLDMRPL